MLENLSVHPHSKSALKKINNKLTRTPVLDQLQIPSIRKQKNYKYKANKHRQINESNSKRYNAKHGSIDPISLDVNENFGKVPDYIHQFRLKKEREEKERVYMQYIIDTIPVG